MDKKDIQKKEQAVVSKFKRNEKIGFVAFLALTSSMVLTVYEYPLFATAGWALILFLLLVGICFFLPIALAAAEMGTVQKWEKGGIFVWVRNTLGRRWGFVAIFYQWAGIGIAFMAMLYFVTSGFGFVFGGVHGFNLLTQNTSPATNAAGQLLAPFQLSPLDHGTASQIASINAVNNIDALPVILVAGAIFGVAVLIFVVITVTQLFGVKYTALIARIGFSVGIAIPTFILIGLGSAYIAQGNTIHTLGSAVPGQPVGGAFTRGLNGEFSLITFIAVVLSFMGPEGSGNLANKLNKPNRNYPLAVITLLFIAISFSTLSGIMIAVSTNGAISQTGGVTLAFINFFLQTTKMSVGLAIGITRAIIFFICLGIVAQVAAWVIGPASGLQYAAKQKCLPAMFAKTNRFGIPIVNLAVQTAVVIMWEIIITIGLGSQGGSSFQAGISVTVIVYICVYFLMFIGYIRMMVKAPKLVRAFTLKKRWISITMGVIGFTISALTWCVSFMNISGTPNDVWFSVIFVLSIVVLGLPFIIYELVKKYNKKHHVDLTPYEMPILQNSSIEEIKEFAMSQAAEKAASKHHKKQTLKR